MLDVYTQRGSRFFPQQEHIQFTHHGAGHERSKRHARRDHTHVDPGAAIEAAHQPEHNLLRDLIVHKLQRND
jgi:hypothetical protein